ncbi:MULTISPECIES: IS110 family transposase [Williamsia]|uniref:Transposase n=1 Tax=Williamsia limnetica TaxID=882452 RepID=A0A318RMP3_WILLI|nr:MULTISPECIES: IS110 family transposase [Williamsia]ORM38155.1 IS110 family transposase [Williamsia sp. 1135]PYE12490.1 transposase [Williamsia limnetica]
MIVIGIDPHKSSHTATAVDPATNVDLGSLRIRSTEPDYQALLEWAGRWPEHRWAVENAKGLGHHLSLWLVQQGESVVDVPSTATARVRQLSRGGRRKNDRIDAAAAACVAALQGDERPVFCEDYTSVLRVLDERRRSLLSAKSRLVNQLHAVLRQLLPGGADVDLDSEKASVLLRRFVPETPADVMRHRIALELVGDLRRLDVQLADISERTETTLTDCGSTLTTIFGCGPVTAGRIIARTGNPFRFATEAAFATYSGTAPVQIASADSNRHRLSRDGDRVLNSALHVIAVCQGRNANSPGYPYLHNKIDAGMTRRSAMRCLKRQVAKKVWRTMCQDHRRWEAREQLREPAAV